MHTPERMLSLLYPIFCFLALPKHISFIQLSPEQTRNTESKAFNCKNNSQLRTIPGTLTINKSLQAVLFMFKLSTEMEAEFPWRSGMLPHCRGAVILGWELKSPTSYSLGWNKKLRWQQKSGEL